MDLIKVYVFLFYFIVLSLKIIFEGNVESLGIKKN